MRYLLVNHVPFAAGSRAGSYRIGDMWREDLAAQAKAIAGVGGTLTVATCYAPQVDAAQTGSFNTVEILPEDVGFTYVELPLWKSHSTYMKVRKQLKATLTRTMQDIDIAQLDYGGYGFSLGQAGWPIAGALGKKRIWLFDGADPFPRMDDDIARMRNPIKRLILKALHKQFVGFCRTAIRDADLVFAHNKAVQERFADVWSDRCYQFDRSFVTDSILVSDDRTEELKCRLLDRSRPLRLVSAGRQVMIKATDQVLRAMRSAVDHGANLQLDIMGDGEDLPKFVKLIAELNLRDRVRVLGTVAYGQQLFDAWGQCDVMVITNLTAEISRNVLLAAARGLPIVTYTNPGTDAMLTEAGAALITPRADEAKLADAFVEIERDRVKLIPLLDNARLLASSKTLERTHRKRAELAREMFDRSK
ncbi:MAG: glycosyltransferase [Tepidisphaeraceae bacterium]